MTTIAEELHEIINIVDKSDEYVSDFLLDKMHLRAYLLEKLTALAKRAEKEQALEKWISIKDQLPEPWKKVLILADGVQRFGVLTNNEGWVDMSTRPLSGVTHWQPEPSLPKV